MPVGSYWPVQPPARYGAPGPQAPALGEDEFLAELQHLLPRGRAWTRDPDSNLTAFLRGFALMQGNAQARINHLLVDAFPLTTFELLPEWELSLGLPDPCAGEDQTYAQRLQHVAARITNRGGQSIPYLIEFAASLGLAITIEEFTAARIGSPLGLLSSDSWAHALLVRAPPVPITYERISGQIGDRLATWPDSVLVCELLRVAPAQAILIFAYGAADDEPSDGCARIGSLIGARLCPLPYLVPLIPARIDALIGEPLASWVN